jgi:endoglucanase
MYSPFSNYMTDNATWITLQDVQNNTSLSNDFTNLTGTGRYVRIYGTARGTTYGYSIYELEVYGTAATTRMATTTPAVAAPGNEQSISVYPIPAHDEIIIRIPDGSRQKSQVIISDINGKICAIQSVSGNTYRMNVRPLPAGLYIVQVINGNKKSITRMVKK